jgi:NADPH:quinone reductase-like Zn-dependent oxidoreductase
MKAIRIHSYGGPEVLVLEETQRPEPKAGEVLVHLKAAGVNPVDWKFRAGYFQQFMPVQFPWILGVEGAGIIEAVGADVKSLKVGQEVYGTFTNSYAQYAVAPVNQVFAKPKHLSFEQAAAVPMGALTAWQAVVEEAEVKSGQAVLIQGGAGGVGIYTVQLAKWKGARVIATASSSNTEFVRSLGAEQVIDYQTTNFEDVVRDVDAVIDTVGGDLIARSLAVIRNGGKFVTVAGRVAPEVGAERDILVTAARRADPDKLEQITALLEAGKLKPFVGRTFALSEVRQAHELGQTGHGRGRIILNLN